MRNSNITKNRIRVALLLALVASVIGLAPAFSASARAGSFSINDVSGNYVELANGWAFGNGVVNFDPISQVGLVTFTPATGTFHEDLIVRSDLAISRHASPHGGFLFEIRFPKKAHWQIIAYNI